MLIFEENELVSPIYSRALSLTIGKDFAHQQVGKVYVAKQQDSEQTNRRRELLAVEEESHKNKIIEAHGKNHFKLQVMQKFFTQVNTAVNATFDNKENLYSNVLKIEDAAPAILEVLAVRAASINRITPLTKSMPWLADEVVKLVNKPQYRKRADVQVSDPSLALSYIGLDNLKLVMPTFILKNWLPISTAPHPLMKRKIWNDSLAIAMASSLLAKKEGLDTFTAFTAGMFSNIGILAVTRSFLSIYSDLYTRELKNAYESRDKKLHDIMLEFEAAPDLLLEQLITRSSQVCGDLVELMRFDRLRITEAMFDLAYTPDINKMCPLAQIIAKAKAFVAYRSLAREELIDEDEAKLLFTAVQIKQSDIDLLKRSDIDHIKLNFNK